MPASLRRTCKAQYTGLPRTILSIDVFGGAKLYLSLDNTR